MGLKQFLWKTTDRVEIWCTKTFNYNPKQRALELKQDLWEDPVKTEAMNKAIGLKKHD